MSANEDPELIGLFSGGKDSLVACLEAKVKEVVYCRTGVGLNEEYVKSICKRFNWKLNIVEPREGESFENFIQKYNFPKPTNHKWIMAFLKFHPMRKWHNQQKKTGRNIMFVSGIRRTESATRKRRWKSDHNTMDGMNFYLPILNWTTGQVWVFLEDHKIPRSPIYETMHMSGDCMCGAFSSKGESGFLKMFHPEMYEMMLQLEEKYGGKWGNQISMKDMSKQNSLDSFVTDEAAQMLDTPEGDDLICQECSTIE